MLEILAGFLTLLATVLPVIVQHWSRKKSEGEVIREKLVDRDLTKLRADLERLRARKARAVVSQR